jgi:hypothetical protein
VAESTVNFNWGEFSVSVAAIVAEPFGLYVDVDRGRILADRSPDQDGLEHLHSRDQVIAPKLDTPAKWIVFRGTVHGLLASHQASPMPKAHRERRHRAGVHDAP